MEPTFAPVKDYYEILGLNISASQPEIKKAYRQLALQFHPDKNPGDPLSHIRFSEIKEAYEILTDPAKKEYYLEQRWFRQASGQKKSSPIKEPSDLLKLVLKADRHISLLDVHRMNKEGLYHYVMSELIPDENINKLNEFDDPEINLEITRILLKNLFIIPAKNHNEFENQLLKIKLSDDGKLHLEKTISTSRRKLSIESYKTVLIVLIVLMILILIYFASN